MLLAGLLIGLASAVAVILEASQVLDTLIDGITQVVQGRTPGLVAAGVMVAEMALDVFIPSVSGKAAISMPSPVSPTFNTLRAKSGKKLMNGNTSRLITVVSVTIGPIFGCSGTTAGVTPCSWSAAVQTGPTEATTTWVFNAWANSSVFPNSAAT